MPESMDEQATPETIGVESRLRAAVIAILTNKPTDAALILLAHRGKLRLNYSNVAREANCSRTLIGHAGCAFPVIRQDITAHMAASSLEPKEREVDRLRDEVATLNAEIQARDTAFADLVLRASLNEQGRGQGRGRKSVNDRAALKLVGIKKEPK